MVKLVFIVINLYEVHLSKSLSPTRSGPFRFFILNAVNIPDLPIRATYPTNIIPFDFISTITFGVKVMRPTFMKFPLVFYYVSLVVRWSPQHLMRSPGPSKSQVHGRSFIVPHIRRSVLRNEECVRCDFIPWVFPLGQ
jgi:hypothetical protein